MTIKNFQNLQFSNFSEFKKIDAIPIIAGIQNPFNQINRPFSHLISVFIFFQTQFLRFEFSIKFLRYVEQFYASNKKMCAM